MEQLPISLEQLIAAVGSTNVDALDLLTDAMILSGRLEELADDLVDHFVRRARDEGASWGEIGQSMGVSKQAAQKRFVKGRRGWARQSRGLFTRFAEDARTTVRAAVDNAEELGSPEVNTLHIAMALSNPASGIAYRAISELASSAEAVADAARDSIDGPEPSRKVGHRRFAGDAKKVLELSLREAIRSASRDIGTDHMLLGLLRDESSPGTRLFEERGVTYEGVADWLNENPATDH